MIINSRRDLDALKGTPDYAGALRAIQGTTTTWVNHGTPEEPDWQAETTLSQIGRLEFASLEDLLAECAAHGVAAAEPEPPGSEVG